MPDSAVTCPRRFEKDDVIGLSQQTATHAEVPADRTTVLPVSQCRKLGILSLFFFILVLLLCSINHCLNLLRISLKISALSSPSPVQESFTSHLDFSSNFTVPYYS